MEHALPWLRLASVPGVGAHLFKRLMARFGSPEAVFAADPAELGRVEGIADRLARTLPNHPAPDWARREIDLAGRSGFRILTQSDPGYPFLLRQIPDPPPCLYVYGDLTASVRRIAIVGSRDATRYGVMAARRLASELAAMGIGIVSGMALGIDTAAHSGALSVGGETIAVLGSGLGRVYPSRNRRLFHQIAESGAVVSEFSIDAGPEAHHFPIRNRIISGMSLGVVVVEAAARSGSLITARLAAEQDREVFAIPGSIHSGRSAGAHNLIKQGARLVEGVDDILDELAHMLREPDAPAVRRTRARQMPLMDDDESAIYRVLGPEPIHIDDLCRRLAMAPARLLGLLTQLELKGVVIQSPGKLFSVEMRHVG